MNYGKSARQKKGKKSVESKNRKESKNSRRECNPPPLIWRFANSKILSHELDRVSLRSGFGTTRLRLKSNPDHRIDGSYPKRNQERLNMNALCRAHNH
jgi:hypothetical protein